MPYAAGCQTKSKWSKWGRFYLLTGMPGFGSDKLCRDQQE